jgi:phosphate transport system protein
MPGHIVSAFDEELTGLAETIAEIGGRADYMVENGVSALLRADHELAREVIAADKQVNALQRDLEERAVLIIARRQPMAQDLREIIAAIRIANELERIADLGKNIARRTLAIDSQPISRDLVVGLEHLADLGLRQLKRVLDSYGARDVELARRVWHGDDEIDAVYVSYFRQVISYMIEDPRKVTLSTHLLFCAKNIERVGDHCTNIAETVHYLVTAEPLEEHADEAAEAGG